MFSLSLRSATFSRVMEVISFYDERLEREMMEGLRSFQSPVEQRKLVQERVINKHRYASDRQFSVENDASLYNSRQHKVIRKAASMNDLEQFERHYVSPASSRRNSKTYMEIHNDNIEAARAESVASRTSSLNGYSNQRYPGSRDVSQPNSRLSMTESVSSIHSGGKERGFNQEKYIMMRKRGGVYSDPNFTRADVNNSVNSVQQNINEDQGYYSPQPRRTSYNDALPNEKIFVTMSADEEIIAINKLVSKGDRKGQFIGNNNNNNNSYQQQRVDKPSSGSQPHNGVPLKQTNGASQKQFSKDRQSLQAEPQYRQPQYSNKTEKIQQKSQQRESDVQNGKPARNTPPKNERVPNQNLVRQQPPSDQTPRQQSYPNKTEKIQNRSQQRETDVQNGKPARNTPPKNDRVPNQNSIRQQPPSDQTPRQQSYSNKTEKLQNNRSQPRESDMQSVQPSGNTPPKNDRVPNQNLIQYAEKSPVKRVMKANERTTQQNITNKNEKINVARKNERNERNQPEWYNRATDKQEVQNKDKGNVQNKQNINTERVPAPIDNSNRQRDIAPIIKKSSNLSSNLEPKSGALRKTNSFKVVGRSSNFFGYLSKEEEALRVKKKVTFSNDDDERPDTA